MRRSSVLSSRKLPLPMWNWEMIVKSLEKDWRFDLYKNKIIEQKSDGVIYLPTKNYPLWSNWIIMKIFSITYLHKWHCLALTLLFHCLQHILMYDSLSSNILLYILPCSWNQPVQYMEAEQNRGLEEGMQGKSLLKTNIIIFVKKDLADDLRSELTTLEYKTFWVSVFQSPCKQNSLINEKIATSIFGTKIECY